MTWRHPRQDESKLCGDVWSNTSSVKANTIYRCPRYINSLIPSQEELWVSLQAGPWAISEAWPSRSVGAAVLLSLGDLAHSQCALGKSSLCTAFCVGPTHLHSDCTFSIPWPTHVLTIGPQWHPGALAMNPGAVGSWLSLWVLPALWC